MRDTFATYAWAYQAKRDLESRGESGGTEADVYYIIRKLQVCSKLGVVCSGAPSSDVCHPSHITPARPSLVVVPDVPRPSFGVGLPPFPPLPPPPRECAFVCPLHQAQTTLLVTQRILAQSNAPSDLLHPQEHMPSPTRERSAPWPTQTPASPPPPSFSRRKNRRWPRAHVDRRATVEARDGDQIPDEVGVREYLSSATRAAAWLGSPNREM